MKAGKLMLVQCYQLNYRPIQIQPVFPLMSFFWPKSPSELHSALSCHVSSSRNLDTLQSLFVENPARWVDLVFPRG